MKLCYALFLPEVMNHARATLGITNDSDFWQDAQATHVPVAFWTTEAALNISLKRYRMKVAAIGSRRIEVRVPNRDAALVKSIAESLRSGGKRADLIRDSLKPIVATTKARSGAELVAFFRASPLVQDQLDITRNSSSGRSVDLP